jgi:hypothetical protein
MGTRWRGLLAPLGITTGDGRRFAKDSVTWRELPLGLKWQRNDDMGHDDSVIIGSVDDISIGTVADALAKGWITDEGVSSLEFPKDTLAVWGTGELFDDVDRAELPRLAEDVAEARLLTARKVIGPSVDAGAAEAVLAEPGSDEAVSEERLEEIFEDAWENGTAVELEVLFTEYQIAAATLVNIPAFAQCLPFTLEDTDDPDDADADDADADAALVASRTRLAVSLVAACGTVTDVAAFADPEFTGVTAITIGEPDDNGVRRVFGHVAAFGVCHAGIRDVCTTAPTSAQQYQPFHRYTTTGEGQELPVAAGRITVAHGDLTGACQCCPGIDDHACNRLSLGATIAHYDRARPVAYVRAGEDQFGIWVSGIIAPEASDADVATLARQKVSGDWRENAGALELVEVLALNREKPGFPLPRAAMNNGRQMSLVAAGTVAASRQGRPVKVRPPRPADAGPFDYDRMAAAMTRALAPILPPGTHFEYDTTPVLDAATETLHAPADGTPADGTPAATTGDPDHAQAAADLAAELDGTLNALDAAQVEADLERITADV